MALSTINLNNHPYKTKFKQLLMYAKVGFTSKTEEIKIKTLLSFIKMLSLQFCQPQNICAPHILSHNLKIFNTQYFVLVPLITFGPESQLVCSEICSTEY